jgi:hypothetical protein
MIFAEVTLDGDLSTCVWQGLLFLLLLGGVLFLLCYVMNSQAPVASDDFRKTRSGPKVDSLHALNATKNASEPAPLNGSHRRQDRGSPKDNRRSLRRGGNPVPVLVSDLEAGEETLQGLVLNRSRGGLCLSVPHRVEVGRLLSVRTPDYPEDLGSVQIRVRHCKRKGDSFQLGCQFMETHPWSVLLLFG